VVRVREVCLFSSIYALAVHLCSAVRMHTTRSFSFEIAAAIVAFFITAAQRRWLLLQPPPPVINHIFSEFFQKI